MPHLSPMSWILTPMLFYIILMMYISCLWWSQTPKFPYMMNKSTFIFNKKWNWS